MSLPNDIICAKHCVENSPKEIGPRRLGPLNEDEISPPEFFRGRHSNETIPNKAFHFHCQGVHKCPGGLRSHLFVFCHLYIFVSSTATVELEQMQLQSVQVDKVIEVDIFQRTKLTINDSI